MRCCWAIRRLSIWYWCADQTIVQRVLGAKDENHARTGPLFCGLIKVFPVFVFILPGLLFLTMIQGGKIDGLAQLRIRSEQTVAVSGKQYQLELTGKPLGGQTEKISFTEGQAPLDLTKELANDGKPLTLMSGLRLEKPGSAAQCHGDVVQGNVRPDDQKPDAGRLVWRDGGGADGGVDGQSRQRLQFHRHAVQLRFVSPFPPGRRRNTGWF